MSFAAAVGRHWLSGSSSSKLSTGAMLLMGALSSTATAVTFCDDGKKGDSLTDRLFPKNAKGETDWSAAVVKMQSNQFWDVIAKQAGSQVQGAVDSGIPTQLSYGFISGYCSGMAMKKVGKVAAGIFGMGFMTLQFLSYSGYVHVDHVKIQEHVRNALDLNDDGSVDGKDRAIALDKLMEILQFNLPAGSGFTAGFVGGLRSG